MPNGSFLNRPLWSAPAERSGDGAFLDSRRPQIQSGVTLRLPPDSKIVSAIAPVSLTPRFSEVGERAMAKSTVSTVSPVARVRFQLFALVPTT
jgi:hypothetical protein